MSNHLSSLRSSFPGALLFPSALCCLAAGPMRAAPAAAPKQVRLAYKYRPKQVQKFRKVVTTRTLMESGDKERPVEAVGTIESIIREEVLQVKEGVGAMRLRLESFTVDQTFPDRRVVVKSVDNQPTVQVDGLPVEDAQLPPGTLGAPAGVCGARDINIPIIALRDPQGRATQAPGYPPVENAVAREIIGPLLIFPDRALKVGQSWKSRAIRAPHTGHLERTPVKGGPVVMEYSYTLKALENRRGARLAVVDLVANGKSVGVDGLPPSDLSYRGTVRFDVTRGAIVSAQIRGNNNGMARNFTAAEEGKSGAEEPDTIFLRVRFTYDITEIRAATGGTGMKRGAKGVTSSAPRPKKAQ